MGTIIFIIKKHYAAFYCDFTKNDLHKNVAYIIALGKDDDVTVTDEFDAQHTGRALLISPLVEHSLISSGPAWHFYFAPYSAFAVKLSKLTTEAGISELPVDVLPFNAQMSNQEITKLLDKAMARSSMQMDCRLAAVLEDLDMGTSKGSLTEIAKQHNLSTSRLRALAKDQVGVPLSTLILWRKSVKSMKALSLGASLSDAAQAGGFSDQAHFTRTTHKTFGVTPNLSLGAFNYTK